MWRIASFFMASTLPRGGRENQSHPATCIPCWNTQMADPLSSRELAAFLAAVEAGSVQGAAEALDLTQSATTKRLQALERRLGVALLHRGRHGVRPTEEGMALYPEARRGLDALALAEDAVRTHRAARPLRIAASHTVGEALLPSWLTAFRAELPGVHPQVDVTNSPGAILAVREERADVGFVEGDDALDGLEAKVVARDRIVLVVAAGHRWARRRFVNPKELARGRWISREVGSGTRAVAAAALAEVGVELEPDLSLSSLEGVKRSLAAGGFALISELALEPDLGAGRLVAPPLKGLEIERALVAIRRQGGRPHEQARRFWSWLPVAP
jgi:DNA-binding transcriptional LysR family regulator